MAYAVGQQEKLRIADLVDDAGNPVNGETLNATFRAPDGTTTNAASSNPGGANDYEVLGPTFNQPGRWHWYITGTTPNIGLQGEWIVDYSPAAP